MIYSESLELVKWESENPKGILILFRKAQMVPLARFQRLKEALKQIVIDSEAWSVIDRDLAGSLHALSFHLEGLSMTLKENGKLTADIEEELPYVYELIDQIFGT